MRAVAQAHQRTGAPITVHTHPGTRTAEHVKRVMVDEEGVDPTVIVLGHSGDTTDVDYLESLAQQGFTLGMDRFGINVGTTFEAAPTPWWSCAGAGWPTAWCSRRTPPATSTG